MFLNVVLSTDLSILLDNFTVLVPRSFLKQESFLNQIDKCKVVALEIAAVQAVGPEFPLWLFNYFHEDFPKI